MKRATAVVLGHIILLGLLSLSATAHVDSGIEKEVNGYTADLGYTPERIKAETSTSFVVSLENKTTEEAHDITSVWLRISNEKGVLFAGRVLAEHNAAVFSYRFPEEGKHSVDVRFYKNKEMLAEAEFELDVGESEQAPANKGKEYEEERREEKFFWIIASALAGLGLGLIIGKNKKRRPGKNKR